jgi:hypothetical protein
MPSKRTQIERVAAALLATQPEMIAAYGRGRCIVCTRVALEVAREQGLRADPVPVAVDLESELGEGRMGFEPPAAVPAGNWNGHLVCVLENRRLVDMTLDTATDSARGFDLKPIAFEVSRDFTSGGIAGTSVGKTRVRYEAHPEEKGFLSLEDWNDRPERDRTLDLVRRRLGL